MIYKHNCPNWNSFFADAELVETKQGFCIHTDGFYSEYFLVYCPFCGILLNQKEGI